MKIERLLENASMASFGALSPFHIATLKRIADGRLDPLGEVSPKTQEYLDELVNLGFLDATYDISDAGQRAISVASKIGTQDLRDAKRKGAARRAANMKDAPVVDVPVDDLGDDLGDDLDSELEKDDIDVDFGGTLSTPKKKKVVRDTVRPLRATDFDTLDGKSDFIDKEFDWEE